MKLKNEKYYSYQRPIRINRVEDAKRLMKRLILGFQNGKIKDDHAKTLTYLLVSYISICKECDGLKDGSNNKKEDDS